MLRVLADLFAHVPATLALGVGQGLAFDFCLAAAHQLCFRGDQHEAQIVPQRIEQCEFFTVGVKGDPGLQRGADFSSDAQFFQRMGDFGTVAAQLAPFVEQCGFSGQFGQRLPRMQHDRIFGILVQRLPDFFRGEGKDRGHQFDEAVGDMPQRVLCRAPCPGILGRGVEAILEDVEVKTAEVFRAEGLQRLHDAVEFVLAVIGLALVLHLPRHGQRVAVDFQPFFGRQGVFLRVKIDGVGQQEAQRVADAPVGFDNALQNFVRDRDFTGIIGGCCPQAQDVGPQSVGNLLRGDDVAHRFGHLAALAVDDETVRQECLVRRTTVNRAAGQQRTLEPATMLVGAFEVHVGRILAVSEMRATHHREVGGAGIEPHVERVLHLDVLVGIHAQQLFRVEREPGFDP